MEGSSQIGKTAERLAAQEALTDEELMALALAADPDAPIDVAAPGHDPGP